MKRNHSREKSQLKDLIKSTEALTYESNTKSLHRSTSSSSGGGWMEEKGEIARSFYSNSRPGMVYDRTKLD
jgi:hypothetical protein